MNPIDFLSRWGKGMKSLTQAQILHSKVIGNLGQLMGMIFAFIFLLYYGYWYFGLFMFFALFLQVITLIAANQEYENYCKMIDEIKEEKDGIARI